MPRTAIYSTDILIAATVYVRAESLEKARAQVAGLRGKVMEFEDAGGSEVAISGLEFTNPDLPDLSLSPSMTIQPVDADDLQAMTLAEDDPTDEDRAVAAGYQVVFAEHHTGPNPFIIIGPAGDDVGAAATEAQAWEAAAERADAE